MNIEFLAHRGLWSNREERNSWKALSHGLDCGFGLETDVRDFENELVISHDIPTDSPIPLDNLLKYYSDCNFNSTLALNIKADGLQEKLLQLLAKYKITQYFVFDMSIPDTLGYLKTGIRTFIRRSELEIHPELTQMSQGVWLDELTTPWIDARAIIRESKNNKSLCIVSGELHGREYRHQWNEIRDAMITGCANSHFLLCTDVPNEAKRFFK